MNDLIERTWKSSPEAELTRDEKRLMRKYQATLAAERQADIEAWRRCPKCSPELNHSEGSTP